jgi:O-methyltransferase
MRHGWRRVAHSYLPKPLVAALRGRGTGVRFLAVKDFSQRWQLLGRFQEISDHVECHHSEGEALLIASKILALPPGVAGDVVECGSFQGGSTAKLSLIARGTNRKLTVFDSFEGLPDEHGAGAVYENIHNGMRIEFNPGDYAATLEKVSGNVARYGEPSGVEYVKGFFEETMPRWEGRAAAIYLDVDLVESTRSCLRHLWPRLAPGGMLFSQDCHLREVVELFADSAFWASLGEQIPPKFAGLGREKLVYAYKTGT